MSNRYAIGGLGGGALGALALGGMAHGTDKIDETEQERKQRIRDQILVGALLGGGTGLAGTSILGSSTSNQGDNKGVWNWPGRQVATGGGAFGAIKIIEGLAGKSQARANLVSALKGDAVTPSLFGAIKSAPWKTIPGTLAAKGGSKTPIRYSKGRLGYMGVKANLASLVLSAIIGRYGPTGLDTVKDYLPIS